MQSVHAIPGAAALFEWLLAVALYAISWSRARSVYSRIGDGLGLAGLVTALAGVAWFAWDGRPGLVLARSSLATGLAIAVVVVYAALAYRREERLSALLVLAFAVSLQAYAVGRLWWLAEAGPEQVFLPIWAALKVLAGLVGYAGLVVAVLMIVLSFTLYRAQPRLRPEHVAAAVGLRSVEGRAVQVALVSLSVSLAAGLVHTWWGLGQVVAAGNAWALAAWLLLAGGAYGLMHGVVAGRLARVLLVAGGILGVLAALGMAG